MAKKGSINLSILSTYDSKGTDKAEKALQKFAKQYGEVDKATKQVKLDPVAEQFAKQSIEADKTAAKLKSYSDTATNVGKKLSTAITLPIAAAGAAAFKLSTDFENAIAKVSTIADTTEVPIDDLRKAILDLSNDTGVAASDIANNVYDAISAGQKTGDAVAFVGNAAKLAKAGFTDSANALDILTTTMNAYRMESSETSRVSDIFLQTQNKGKTTVGDLAASIGKVIPTAAAFNVSLENLAAAYATTTANGIATKQSTTYLNAMLQELGDTGSTVGDIIANQTGKSFSEFMAEGGSLAEVMKMLNIVTEDSGLTMFDLFNSATAATAATSLAAGGAEQLASNFEAMNHSAGLTDESFNKMKTTTGSMNRAFNQIKNVVLEFGDAVVADAKPIIDGFVEGVKGAAEWFGKLTQEQRQTIVGVAAFAAALGPTSIALGKVLDVGSNVVKKYSALKAAQAAVRAAEAGSNVELTKKTQTLAKVGDGLQKYVTKSNLAKAGAAGLAVVIAGVVIKALMDAAEHQRQYTVATDGLATAQGRAQEAAKRSVESMRNAGTEAQNAGKNALLSSKSWQEVATSVDACIESQAQLAESLKKTFEDAYTTTGQLDTYMSTIDELANKSNLTETEQSRLANAVQGLNEIMGTSYEVTDSLNGKISDQEGHVLSNTDAIKKLVEAKKLEIQMDALAEAAKETYKRKEEAARAYADAQDLVNQRQKEYDDALARGESNLDTYQANLDIANGKLDEAKGVLDSATKATDSYNDQLNLMQTAQRKGANSVHALVANHSEVAAVMSKNGQSVSKLADQLEELGITTEDLGEDAAGVLMKLAADYDGNLDSIIRSCENAGEGIPKGMADKINQNKGKVTKAAGDMSKDASKAAENNADGQGAGAKLSDTTSSGIKAAAGKPLTSAASMIKGAIDAAFSGSDASAAGRNVSSTAAGGINVHGADAAAKSLGQNAIATLKNNASGTAAGKYMVEGVRDGIVKNAYIAGNAMMDFGKSLVQKLFKSTGVNSPSKFGIYAGEMVDEGVAVGVDKYISKPEGAVSRMTDRVLLGLQDVSDYEPDLSAVPNVRSASVSASFMATSTSQMAYDGDVSKLLSYMADLIAEVRSLKNSLGQIIRDNAPTSVETPQQFARRVQKAVPMNV